MNQELITYSFDAEEWDSDGALIDFTQLAYPDILEELAYGDLALTDALDHSKCLHLSEVELGYLALNLAYHAEQMQAGKTKEAVLASVYQHFEISLQMQADKNCLIGFVEEPEKSIEIHIDTFVSQARAFRQNLWADMAKHYPAFSDMEGYEEMRDIFTK